jgi:hypothetical protein
VLKQAGYSIFDSFSTAVPAVCEVFACSGILSEHIGKKIRSNTISGLLGQVLSGKL